MINKFPELRYLIDRNGWNHDLKASFICLTPKVIDIRATSFSLIIYMILIGEPSKLSTLPIYLFLLFAVVHCSGRCVYEGLQEKNGILLEQLFSANSPNQYDSTARREPTQDRDRHAQQMPRGQSLLTNLNTHNISHSHRNVRTPSILQSLGGWTSKEAISTKLSTPGDHGSGSQEKQEAVCWTLVLLHIAVELLYHYGVMRVCQI